jgi:hypothetical protein
MTGVSFQTKGPMFETPAQVGLGFQEAVNNGLLHFATIEGANVVLKELYPGHGQVTGELKRHVMAKDVRDNLVQVDAGEAMYGNNLIYSSWVEGIDDRNRPRPGFPGWHMFKKAEQHMENSRDLMDEYIGEAVAEAMG